MQIIAEYGQHIMFSKQISASAEKPPQHINSLNRPAAVRVRQRLAAWLSRGWRWLGAGLVLLCALLWGADRLDPLPLPKDDMARVVLAADGTPLWRFADANGVWRYPVRIEQVSPYYIEALLGYEDRWFYQHLGINPFAIARAAWQNLSDGRVVSGGSTLSMQVARLLEPHPRTLRGKLRQLWRTLQLEWHLSKDEILTLYLNRAPFGGTLEGVAAASWAYLGKAPKSLSRAEAALLAVLPQAPSRLRPDRHPQRAQAARDKILQRLAQFKVWPPAAIDDARQERVWLAPRHRPALAPLLARRLNHAKSPALIETTIDASLQRRLEDMLLGWRARLPERSSAAILVVEHETMAVQAYLGSLDLQDAQRFGHVDMVQALRSPGSTLKPFLYGLALDDGLIHSESLLQDVPRHAGDYRPGNFSQGFSGPVSASQALSRSLNLPVVQLLEVYGPKRFTGELRNAGLSLVFPRGAEPNLALILGGVGSRLEDLVSGFSAFARQGKVAQLRFQPQQALQEKPLMSPGAAWIVRRILSGQRRPDLDPRAQLVERSPLAWKTGTSYGFRDAWAIGVSSRYLIGIWLGRPDGTPVAGQFGLASATPLLLQVHDVLNHRDRQNGLTDRPDPQPAAVGVAAICWPLGQVLPRSESNCRRLRFAWTLNGTIPPTLSMGEPFSSDLQPLVWLNQQGLRVGKDCPGAQAQRIALWPAALEPWLAQTEQRGSRLAPIDPSCPPALSMLSAPLQIVGVSEGDRLQRPAGQQGQLRVQFSSLGGGARQWWYLNGTPLLSTEHGQSFDQVFSRAGLYQLSVLDESGQTGAVQFSVRD